MAAPIVAAAVTAAQLLPKIGSMFGPSAEFQARQATSDEFFALRNEVFSLESYMSPELLAEWRSLSFHAVDYNTRRENEAERLELRRFVDKLNTYLRSAQPDSRLLTVGATAKPAAVPIGGGSGPILGGVVSGGTLLLIGAGVLAWVIFK